MNLLMKADEVLAKFEYAVLVVLVPAMTLILVTQVILRYFFSSPIFWAEEVAVQILMMVTCIGLSYLIYQNKMVRVDVMAAWVSPKVLVYVEKAVYVISLVVLAVVCFHAVGWLMQPENRLNFSPTTGISKWYNYAVIVASFHLMGFHLLAKLLTHPNHLHTEETSC